jgi:hypothetical protein
MSSAELKLLLIVALLFCGYRYLLRQDSRRNAFIFLLSCATGLIAQAALGRGLNLYTPNITLYISYVSVAVILTWGAGLTSMYAAQNWLARVLGIDPGVGTYTLAGLPILVILEVIGSNVIRMKLHDYGAYEPLMPTLNAMHAPEWLYVYYILVTVLFYGMLKGLRIHSEDWSRSVFRRVPGLSARQVNRNAA